MMKRIGIGILIFGFVLAMGTAAQATPELVVGTGTFSCPGGATEYWQCLSGASGSGESFIIGSDPEDIVVIADQDAFGSAHIWLIGDSSFDTGVTFDGTNLTSLNVGSFGSYNTPYVGIDLGAAGSAGWLETIEPGLFNFNGGSHYYRYEGVLDSGGGGFTSGNWLFAVAAVDGLDGTGFGASGHDQFSPKTTSAVVPEPGTVLLLGSGLLGLVLYRRKFQA